MHNNKGIHNQVHLVLHMHISLHMHIFMQSYQQNTRELQIQYANAMKYAYARPNALDYEYPY